MNRRDGLKLAALAAAGLALGGHTPYGQWVVYRMEHLVIGCHRDDPRTYDLAQQVVATLDEHLPEASARIARARFAGRLASLLGTDQLQVAILGEADAAAMLEGVGDFAPYGAVELNLLARLSDRLLVARRDFPDRHAWLVTAALSDSDLSAADDDAATPSALDWHPGSLAFRNGELVPEDAQE